MYLISFNKLFSLILILFLVLTVNKTLAQTQTTIYTPLGTPVFDTYITPELASWEITYLNQYFTSLYPNAILLANASGTYNCHGYAWHMTQGGGNVWLGYYTVWAEDIYWQDGSYAEATSQANDQKVSYRPDYEANHSAITTSVNNIFKSKWGQGPLMQHSHNYCPYWYPGSTTLKFYYNPWPVGIEDWIEIILETTQFNVNQMYVGYNSAVFHDEWPYGDYIVSWGPWKIEAFLFCGKLQVFEYPTSYYINIQPLPDGYLWQRDGNGNVLAMISTSGIDNTGYTHYASVPITIGNVPNTFITQGTLTSNTNWRGCVTITGDITVPAGITLTIHPNSLIVFQNNASLIVNGTLNAQSCELNGGINTSWGSVTFNGSGASSSILNNVLIKDGIGVRCLNNANVTIQNSRIKNCTQGVYFYNSEPRILSNQIIEPVQNGINGDASGKRPLILHNTIKKTNGNPQYKQYQGIILANRTNGYIAHNDISGFYWGIYCGGGTNGYFSDYYYYVYNPNNRITNNRYGFAAGWGSFILAGGDGGNYCNYNSVYNNSPYDAKSYQKSNILAKYNWWGDDGAQISVDGSSTLVVSNPLSYDPWGGIPNEEDLPVQSIPPGDEENSFVMNLEDIMAGISLEKQGRFAEAVLHYKRMIIRNTSPGFAITQLVGLRKLYPIPNILEYLQTLLSGNKPYKPIVLNIIAGILLEYDRYSEAIQLYDLIINEYPNSHHSVNALFEKFFAALNYKNDRVLAEQLLLELIALGLTDEEYLMRLEIAENLFNEGGSQYFGKSNANKTNSEVDVPIQYALLGNYPNPFNPTTTISYALPYQSSVDLVIYDIMGREVKAFSLPVQSSGYQTIIWDGTNGDGASVSTGVYLYRINIKSLENKEVFIKTSKLMLLK